ncbi:MAG: hypothetical protein L6Q68_13060, partial [Aquabacterium sp.]|nr:hypothetical protein [Aquabacterium sp.]
MATLTVTDIVVSEADGFAEFIVRLDGTAPGVVTVQYQNTNYSAIHNKDYRYVDGTLTFAPGETTKTVRLELIDDTTAEPPEHFMLELRNPTNATLARAHAAAYVVDNDTIVDTPQVYVRDVVVDEKAGTATFEVRLGHYYGQSAGAAVSVQYATRDAGAVAGQDYSALSGTLTFAPGESVKTVVVDLLDDSVAEALERFELVLSHPVGVTIGDGVAMARIGPSDGTLAAAPRLSVADITVGEADGYAEFVVTMHAPSSNVVTVQYQNTNYSAIHNKDYRYVDGTLTFAPGETTKT